MTNSEDEFVGRDRELGELTAALDDAMAGRGRIILLVGEPGIGKSRLALETATIAAARSVPAVWGRSREDAGQPPYWAWTQAFRQLDLSPRSDGSPTREISDLLFDGTAGAMRAGSPGFEDPAAARFRLHDRITNLLISRAREKPVLLVLEDLHWADDPSLQLLQFIAPSVAGTKLMLLGTCRDTEGRERNELTGALGVIATAPESRVIRVPGLTEAEGVRLARSASSRGHSRAYLSAIYRQSNGNPFFVRQLAIEASTAGPSDPTDELLPPIPTSVHEAIRRRLNRLSHDCGQVLRTAALLGDRFSFRALAAACRGQEEDPAVLASLEEALGARLIEVAPDGEGMYVFSHALIRRALADGIAPSRVARLHACIGEALEETYGADASRHLAELADHFVEAREALGPRKGIDYSIRAGERALRTLDHAGARRRFEAVLEIADDQASRARAMGGLWRSMARTFTESQVARGVEWLKEAFEYHVGNGDSGAAVDLAATSAASYVSARGLDAIVSRAIDLVPPDSLEAGRLWSRRIVTSFMETGDERVSAGAAGHATRIAREKGDARLELLTVTSTIAVQSHQGRRANVLELAPRAFELARLVDDPHTEEQVRFWCVLASVATGDPRSALEHSDRELALASRMRSTFRLASALSARAGLMVSLGRWEDARELAERALEQDPTDLRPAAVLCFVDLQTGDETVHRAAMDRVIAMADASPSDEYTRPFLAVAFACYAEVTGNQEAIAKASALAEAATESPARTLAGEWYGRAADAIAGFVKGDVARAARQREALEQVQSSDGWGYPWNDRVLANVVAGLREFDRAESLFNEAISFRSKADYGPELAWAAHDYAVMLINWDAPGTRERAESNVELAATTAERLRMRPLLKRLAVLRERLRARPIARNAFPDRLTRREVDVLRLIALGRSNREIGEALVISENTVIRHVSNIFGKIGVSNRAEAAIYAERRGLTIPSPNRDG